VFFFLYVRRYCDLLLKNVTIIIILGQYFSVSIKRDALEFLTALCTKYDYIKKTTTNIKLLLLIDASRDNTKVITDNNVILSISIRKVTI